MITWTQQSNPIDVIWHGSKSGVAYTITHMGPGSFRVIGETGSTQVYSDTAASLDDAKALAEVA